MYFYFLKLSTSLLGNPFFFLINKFAALVLVITHRRHVSIIKYFYEPELLNFDRPEQTNITSLAGPFRAPIFKKRIDHYRQIPRSVVFDLRRHLFDDTHNFTIPYRVNVHVIFYFISAKHFFNVSTRNVFVFYSRDDRVIRKIVSTVIAPVLFDRKSIGFRVNFLDGRKRDGERGCPTNGRVLYRSVGPNTVFFPGTRPSGGTFIECPRERVRRPIYTHFLN